ncbi:MAG: hypothetical protein M3Q73_01750 [bacterium]|nr:hypothetical protein [bacterium]
MPDPQLEVVKGSHHDKEVERSAQEARRILESSDARASLQLSAAKAMADQRQS